MVKLIIQSYRRYNLDNAVLILAGGSSSRMKGIDKQLAEIGGVPVIVKSMLAFEKSTDIDEIIVSAGEDNIGIIRELSDKYGIKKLTAIVKGGESRSSSARNAFKAVKTRGIILIHDGARPFIDRETIKRVISAAEEYGAAVPVIPVKDTIKAVKEGFVEATPDRATLFAAQTPQGFTYEIYEKILLSGKEATDDSGLAEAFGIRVKTVEGSEGNIKITTREDLRQYNTVTD